MERKITKVPDIPVGKWVKCNKCKEILYKEDVHNNYSICPNCGYHFRLSSRRRIKQIVDEGTFNEFELNIETPNPLNLADYSKKIEILRQKTGIKEAVLCGITYSIEKAIEKRLPLIIFCVSGGARMQEGIVSLMQMAKTSAALARLDEAGLLYISVLTDPTYGGVTASFASLGDIIISEPETMIGFAGPRVIKNTIKQELPEGFQTSEFLLEHGFIDMIVNRKDMKNTLSRLLRLHKNED